MKKNKIIFVFLIVLIALFISCNGKEKNNEVTDEIEEAEIIDFEVTDSDRMNNKIKYKRSYEIVVGDIFNPFIKDISKSLKFITSDRSVLKVYKDGTVKAIKAGNAIVDAIYKDKYYGTIMFFIKEKETVNNNCTEEEYNDFFDLFNNYNSSEVTLNYSFSFNGINQKIEIKKRVKNFYLELNAYINNEKESLLIKKDNGKYFGYDINEKNKTIKRNYIPSFISLINISDYYQYAKELIVLDYGKIELEKINNNNYRIKVLIKDYDLIYSELVSYGLDEYADNIKDNVLIIDVTFKENKVLFDIKLNIHYIDSDSIIDIPLRMLYSYDFSPIKEFDMTNYRILNPRSIDEVETETHFNTVSVDEMNNNFYYGYLEKGIYALEISDHMDRIDNLVCDVYYKNKNKLTNSFELKNNSYYKNIISIPKSDYYYVSLYWGVSSPVDVKFSKINYISDNEIYLDTNNSGEIKGRYYYQKYIYNSTDYNEVIKLTNNGDDLYLYTEARSSNNLNGFISLKKGECIYINPVDDEKTIIYAISGIKDVDSLNYNYNYSYNFSFESLSNSNGSDYENLDEITTEYDKDYIIGMDYPDRKLKLTVPKEGIYSFYCRGLNEQETTLSVYIEERKVTATNILLYEGDYVINIHLDNEHTFDIIKVRMEYVSADESDINIKLKVVSDYYDDRTISNVMISQDHIVRYHFELTEESCLIFNPGLVKIFDEEGNLRTFFIPNCKDNTEYCFKLPKGKYYAMYAGWEPNPSFDLGIETFNTTNCFSVDCDNVIRFGTDYKLDDYKDYNWLYLVYDTDIDLDVSIEGENERCIIVGDDLIKLESTDEYGLQYRLEANRRYYFIMMSIYNMTESYVCIEADAIM